MAHHGSGVVLKTVFDERENRVLRTIFEKKYVYYRTINDYVPPLFLVVNYEEAAFTRSCFFKRTTRAAGREHKTDTETDADDEHHAFGDLKTDELLRENIKFVESLLVSADCVHEAFQFTFLRLETAGDYQRRFEKLYPLWDVGVGTLARLTFANWQKRRRALGVLTYNAANNRDVYTINYAANVSPVTIIDYLEPLFAYCAKASKQDVTNAAAAAAADRTHYNFNPSAPSDYSSRASGGTTRKKSNAPLAAAVGTSEMFEIEFSVIDDDNGPGAGVMRYSDRVGSNVPTNAAAASKRSTVGRRRKKDNNGSCSTSGCGGGGDDVEATAAATDLTTNTVRNRRLLQTLILEKPRTMCGSLSVHDVRPYFTTLHATRLSRLSLEQLEELPVAVVGFERDFCATTCCVVNRTDNQLTVMHVYYCWDGGVHELLSSFAAAINGQNRDHVMVAVSPPCSEDTEARLKMLEDLKNVIWKDNVNTYVRLAVDDAHDQDMLARNIYEPLVFRLQRHSADMEVELRCSAQSSRDSGSVETFRNAITLDCRRLCDSLDPSVCRFARAYRDLVDSATLCCNGHVSLDRVQRREARMNACRALARRQELYARLVSEFRSERILETAYDMASELRLGLVDVFGTTYTDATDQHVQRQRRAATTTTTTATEDPAVFDSLRASNCVFLETLMDSSMFVGSSGSAAACLAFFGGDGKKSVRPVAQYTRGLYRNDMIEFDLKSAYPSVAVLYNISPETTAIVRRNRLDELDGTLRVLLSTGGGGGGGVGKTAAAGRPDTEKTMTSFYHQIAHVNETCSDLVVVSLRPEIYVGFLARVMEKLVLKRNTQSKLMDAFYKKLANVIYGCTNKVTTTTNDLFSPQCASAIASLCKNIMLRTLQNVSAECVLFSQTDGALLYAGGTGSGGSTSAGCCKHLEDVVRESIAGIVSDIGDISTVNTLVSIVPRVRYVDLCLVIDQNRHLVLYSDGKTVAKGQQQRRLRGGAGGGDRSGGNDNDDGDRLTDSLLSHIATYVRDRFRSDGRVSTELNGFLDSCFEHVNSFDASNRSDWFVTVTVPTVNELLYDTAAQRALTGLGLQDFSEGGCAATTTTLVDTTIARFGDTVAVWPVILQDGQQSSQSFTEFRVFRPSYNEAVRPNRVYVVKNFLRYWVKWLFTICYPDQDECDLLRQFYAVCKKQEQ